jgi:hypothetical protein
MNRPVNYYRNDDESRNFNRGTGGYRPDQPRYNAPNNDFNTRRDNYRANSPFRQQQPYRGGRGGGYYDRDNNYNRNRYDNKPNTWNQQGSNYGGSGTYNPSNRQHWNQSTTSTSDNSSDRFRNNRAQNYSSGQDTRDFRGQTWRADNRHENRSDTTGFPRREFRQRSQSRDWPQTSVTTSSSYPKQHSYDAPTSTTTPSSFGNRNNNYDNYRSSTAYEQRGSYDSLRAKNLSGGNRYTNTTQQTPTGPTVASHSSASASTLAPAVKSHPALPPDWTEYKSDNGTPYYHNKSTGKTQWEFPKN